MKIFGIKATICILVLNLSIVCLAEAGNLRTEKWTLAWDPNLEIYIEYYKVFKKSDQNAWEQIATVSHPNSEYLDQKIVPGVLYAYHVKAVNIYGLESEFSSEVSAAIPLIADIPDQNIIEGESFSLIKLDDYVNDPDTPDDQIEWSVSGNNELNVNIDTNRVATITIPQKWTGSDTIIFTATDPDGFFSSDEAIFTIIEDPTKVSFLANHIPTEFALAQNFPNPFNSITKISFDLPNAVLISLSIYDLSGSIVTNIIDKQTFAAGRYQVSWDGYTSSGITATSGVYIYSLRAGDFIESKKMLLIK